MQHGSMQMEQGAQTQTQDHSAHQAPTQNLRQPKACNTGQDERSDDRSCGDGHAAPQANAAEPAMQGHGPFADGARSPASTPAAPTAQAQSMQGMDHSQMAQPAAADTSGTATPAMQGMDHSQMGHDGARARYTRSGNAIDGGHGPQSDGTRASQRQRSRAPRFPR
jgi:copper resistance protein B